jgi:hypothetical protein
MSEAVADTLDAGDVCGAAGLADDLKNAADAAIAAGQVPPEFQGELTEATTELQNDINCPVEPEEEDNEGEGNGNGGNGKGKGKGHDKDGTTTLGTTTEID